KVPRQTDAERPRGQWNVVVIRCEGFRITYELNGREVNRADCDRPIMGWIGLMNQGSDVRFRNIEIKDLAPSSPTSLSESAQEHSNATARKGAAKRPNVRRADRATPFL